MKKLTSKQTKEMDMAKLQRVRRSRERNRRLYAGQIKAMKSGQHMIRKIDRLLTDSELYKHFGIYPPNATASQLRAVAVKQGIVAPPNSSKAALVTLLARHLASKSEPKTKTP